MKSIIDILRENGMIIPATTIGMGNPLPPGISGELGSEPICINCKKKKKKKVDTPNSNKH